MQLKSGQYKHRPGARREGSVLIIVLVLIMMLTLGVYGFTERMLVENKAAVSHGRSAQATASAASGIELAASTVTTRTADPENPVSLYHRPELFAGIVMYDSATPSAVGRFSLVAPVAGDGSAGQLRFGLSDESGRLNLNALTTMDLDDDEQVLMLMGLPGMTEEIADAILDYVDKDETVRMFGAESEYYQSLVPAYFPKNGPLETVDELLMVRGVTPGLLYGEDTNRNGLLDPGEDDGASTSPMDNGDGVLQIGWAQFLTIHSKESNTRLDGTAKININQGMLTDLYDAIIAEANDEEMAKFIVAYRMYGPNDGEGETEGGGDGESEDDDEESSESSSEESDSRDDDDDEAPQLSAEAAESVDRLAGNLASAISGSSGDSNVTRGGLNLSRGPRYEITSLYELFDREVDVEADEEAGTEAETLTSPWTSANILTDYPMLDDLFTVSKKSAIPGRINVNEARYEVLIGIPGMTEQLASSIVAARTGTNGAAVSEDPSRRTTAWLVAQNLVDLKTMRELDQYLTGRGDVYRAHSVGFFDGGGPQARIEAVIDGTVVPAKIVMYRDLSELGRGFAPSRLLAAGP